MLKNNRFSTGKDRKNMINRDRLNATFMELCATDTQPGAERPMTDIMRARLAELGFSVTEDSAGTMTGGSSGNLFARLSGTKSEEALLFSCHLDRVAPGLGVKPRIENDCFVSSGDTVLGADDAAGLAALLEAITTLTERNMPYPTIEIILSVAEELGLVGASCFDMGQITAGSGFVLDAEGNVGEIVIQAAEKLNFRAVFHGKSAHAGFAPEDGISAIQMAAAALCRMRLLRVDSETTANIGSISGAGSSNIVPERCELSGEVRSLDSLKLQRQLDDMTCAMETAATEFGGTVEITTELRYPSYKLGEDSPAARRAARAAEALSLPVAFKSTGGGSDANIFNSKGMRAVVLCCGYEKPHTTAERMPLEQLALLAQWVLAIINDGDD